MSYVVKYAQYWMGSVKIKLNCWEPYLQGFRNNNNYYQCNIDEGFIYAHLYIP